MHATTVSNASIEPAASTREAALDRLLVHLDGLSRVSVTEVDSAVCGFVGCTRSENHLWHVAINHGRTRTYCPTHAVEFIRDEVGLDE
jgi:hypothetical protein